jgi:hypothetical protein
MNTPLTFKQTFLGSLIAGAGAALGNFAWHGIHGAVSGFSLPAVINVGSLTGASFMPMIVAGIGFFIAQRWIPKGQLVYVITTVILTLVSTMGNFAPTLPDGTPMPAGFAMHTVPMHFISGAMALLIPRFSKRIKA